jgi:hypothetical protein
MNKFIKIVTLSILAVSVIITSPLPGFAEEIARNNYKPTIEQKLNDLVALDIYYEEAGDLELKNPKGDKLQKPDKKINN